MKKLSRFFLLFTFCVNLQAADPQATTPDQEEQQCPGAPLLVRKHPSERGRARHGRNDSMDPAALQTLMSGGNTNNTGNRPPSTYSQRDRDNK